MPGPRIAITMGDAAGVGPEIIMKSLGHRDLYARCRPIVIGDAERLRAAGLIVRSELQVAAIAGSEPDFVQAGKRPGTVDCIDLGLIPADLAWGKLSAVAGDAAFRYIQTATELAMAGKVAAICTAPLNKEALHAGGHMYPGHTELLAALTGTPEVSMMLTAPKLRVIHVTTHMGLLDAIARIEPSKPRFAPKSGSWNMPILEPNPGIDHKIVLKEPDPTIDFKMLIKPDRSDRQPAK